MKILVVDDEPLARERLVGMLAGLQECEVVGEAANGLEALAFLESQAADLMLLDIRMPGMDGLETAHHTRCLEMPPVVVFCTAYDDHALEAFEVDAIDYLLKPVRRARLAAAVDKADRFLSGGAGTQTIPPVIRSHLCARVRGSLELIPISEVIYLRAEHKYVTVCHTGGEVLIEEPLKELEHEFSTLFLRIHRNALVALQNIQGLEKSSNGVVSLRLEGTEERMEVSRRCLPKVRKAIKVL